MRDGARPAGVRAISLLVGFLCESQHSRNTSIINKYELIVVKEVAHSGTQMLKASTGVLSI